jgi:predicted amidohydrolase
MTIAPYNAVGLIPNVRGVHSREEIATNLDGLEDLFAFGCQMSGLDLPVRLVAIPEGALQGFSDEAEDLDHGGYARSIAIDLPGPETERIAGWARRFGVYVMAQAKARHPEIPDRYFNVGFVIDPNGEIILRHYKLTPLYPIEHSMTPHDIFDWWVERYGRSLEAFWPVVDTPIGRLGVMMANEASYPENARALALNGCEIAYRTAFPHPGTTSGMGEIQNRARALDNNMYVLAPNCAAYYPTVDTALPIDAFGGRSMIVDHRGTIVGQVSHGGVATVVSAVIDIAALRHQRLSSPWTNWAKDLRTELYQIAYEQPIYPKNLYAERAPFNHHDFAEQVTRPQIELMRSRGIWKDV